MRIVKVKERPIPDDSSPTKVRAKILNKTLLNTAMVNSDDICQYKLGRLWVGTQFDMADNIWVGIDDEDKLVGFVCVKTIFDYEYPTLEVMAMCSNKASMGKLLLQRVIAFAKENNRRDIMLHSVPHKVSYYKKFGFMVGNDCEGRDEEFTEKSDFYRYENGNKTDTKLHFNSVEQMASNEDAKAFLNEAAKNQYTKDNCLNKKRELDLEDEMTINCLGQGITMFLCFGDDKTPPPTPIMPPKTKTPTPPMSPKTKTLTPIMSPKNKTPTPPMYPKNKTPTPQTMSPTQKKTRKKRLIKSCAQRNKDTNPFTKKCTSKCKNQKVRRERDFRCVKSQTRKGISMSKTKTKKTCEQRNKETNPFTKKCTPKCKNQKVRRERDFRCVKLRLSNSREKQLM